MCFYLFKSQLKGLNKLMQRCGMIVLYYGSLRDNFLLLSPVQSSLFTVLVFRLQNTENCTDALIHHTQLNCSTAINCIQLHSNLLSWTALHSSTLSDPVMLQTLLYYVMYIQSLKLGVQTCIYFHSTGLLTVVIDCFGHIVLL